MNPLKATISLAWILLALPAFADSHNATLQTIVNKTYDFSRTWNTGRVEDYVALYEQSDEFALYYSGGRQVGIEDARELYYAEWPTEDKMGKFEVFDVKARMLSPTSALSHGLFQHRFTDKTVNGNFTLVWVLEGEDKWKIAHEHSARISVETPQ
jgi:hypothetical protein